MPEQSKDTFLTFKSTKQGLDKKGHNRLQLYMSVEELGILIKEFKSVATERGVVLDIHTGPQISKSGKTFINSFAFARGIQEPQQQQTFDAPGVTSAPSAVDKIAALKNL